MSKNAKGEKHNKLLLQSDVSGISSDQVKKGKATRFYKYVMINLRFDILRTGPVNLSKVLYRGSFCGVGIWPPNSLKNCTP